MTTGPRVLLAHSYFLRHDAKQWEKMKPFPPLGTLLVASLLRERGYRVDLFDAMLAGGVEEFVRMVEEDPPGLVGIFEDNFNFLTKMCTVRTREAAAEMIRTAGAAGARVAVNGSDATDRPELYLDAGADAVIVGEPEETAWELFERWRADPEAPLDGIAGLVLPDTSRAVGDAASGAHRGGSLPIAGNGGAGAVRKTALRPPVEDLDALPLPAWDLVDVDRYRDAWEGAHGRLSWNVVTSRGCPYGCNWCAKPIFGRRYTQRSPAAVAEELHALRQAVGPDHVWFADDIFGLTAPWIEAFAEEVERLDAAVPFMMQSRVNLMQPRVVEALRAAGCEEVWMGVESGSQEILDAMDKGTRIDDVRSATRTLKDRGIRACWFIQLGYPGEGWDEILLTRDLIRSERPDDIGVSVAYPLPGTEFFERVRDDLGAKRNWVDSDELAMMFEGTYTTPFYRRVRRLLHDEVDEPGEEPAGGKADGGKADGEGGRRTLDERWRELESVEPRFRSEESSVLSKSGSSGPA